MRPAFVHYFTAYGILCASVPLVGMGPEYLAGPARQKEAEQKQTMEQKRAEEHKKAQEWVQHHAEDTPEAYTIAWGNLTASEQVAVTEINERTQKHAQQTVAHQAKLQDFIKDLSAFADYIIGSDLWSIGKSAILQYLINKTKQATENNLLAHKAQTYLLNLSKAIALCQNKQWIIMKHVESSVFTTTKIMAALAVVPWLTKAQPKYLANQLKEVLKTFAHYLQENNARLETLYSTLEQSGCPLEPFAHTPKKEVIPTISGLIANVAEIAAKNKAVYAIQTLRKLIIDAYNEQIRLESTILVAEQPIQTPQKDLLNAVLQRAYMCDAAFAYQYLLNNIGWLSRYSFTTIQQAQAALNAAVDTYIKNPQVLFGSILDSVTLSCFSKHSPAQDEKTKFKKLKDIFTYLMEDGNKIERRNVVLQKFFNIITNATNEPNEFTTGQLGYLLNQQDNEEAYHFLARELPWFTRYSFWWPTNWQKKWDQVMEQRVSATIERIKREEQKHAAAEVGAA